MQRYGIVNTCPNSEFSKSTLDAVAVCQPYHIEVIDRLGPCRHMGSDDSVGSRQKLIVAACPLPALLVPLRQMTKLHPQDTCLDGVEPAVVPLDVVEVLPRLAVVA